MANMIDYLVWRGELTLEASPWNEVDGLLLATLSYLNFHGIQHPKGWTLEELKRIDALIPSTNSCLAGATCCTCRRVRLPRRGCRAAS